MIFARRADQQADRWHLAARSPTLDGNVSLRAAQSCPPVLGGNSFGLLLSPAEPIEIRRGLRSIETSIPNLGAASIDGETIRLRLDTGIELTRATEGEAPHASLVVERAWNRRDLRVNVVSRRIDPEETLKLDLEVKLPRRSACSISGELATVAVYAEARIAAATPAEERALWEEHAVFFDASYFSSKKGKPTGRYKKELRARRTGAVASQASVRPRLSVVQVGGAPPNLEREADGISSLVIPLDLEVSFSFSGHRVESTLLQPELAKARAKKIEERLLRSFGAEPSLPAVKYFSTFLTSHTAGDPHFFFKPALLIGTDPGFVAVIDGPTTRGLEGLRGVTEPSWFHAVPGVAQMTEERATLSAGARLARVRLCPKDEAEPKLAWR